MGTEIHKTAVVDPAARIGEGVTIGPYSVIGPRVTLGDEVRVGSHVVVEGRTIVGRGSQIHTGAVVGSPPQDKKHNPADEVYLVIGENNVIREYVTMNPGTLEGGGKTVVGDNNLFMAYAHVAHDCVIGNSCVMANSGTLAGHVTLEDNATVGGLSAVHQFVRIGRLSIIGGCSKVVQDVPPFSMCDGHPARVYHLNTIGLKRMQVASQTMWVLKEAFKLLFRSGLSKSHALARIEETLPMTPELEHLIFFAKTSKRGLCG